MLPLISKQERMIWINVVQIEVLTNTIHRRIDDQMYTIENKVSLLSWYEVDNMGEIRIVWLWVSAFGRSVGPSLSVVCIICCRAWVD